MNALGLDEPADARIVYDTELPAPSWSRQPAEYPRLVIPADAPIYARAWLTHVDLSLAQHARRTYGTVSDEARMAAATRLHSSADGETRFFVFHWLRLFKPQADARKAGAAPPAQTWQMPDWKPGDGEMAA